MATVTIGKSYFEALLRKAEFHTSSHGFDFCTDLSNHVTISKAEHKYLLQAVREYQLLKNTLFRGGLTTETLETLLEGERGVDDEPSQYDYRSGDTFSKPDMTSLSMGVLSHSETSPVSDDTAIGSGLQPTGRPRTLQRNVNYGEPASSIDTPPKDGEEDGHTTTQRVPIHDQRTVLVTNLSERTTHKDLAGIVRGGRLLDIFLRNDRTASISFVEGAADFLTHAKRNDVYLHTKRLEFRWSDRQFHVPPHVSNKIASGATRNLVVRGIAGRLTADQIRDHLDHIHNLVVVDLYFRNGDAYISTNSIHNALFARTCMMSRTAYKGTRIDYYPDDCAAPLPRPSNKIYIPVQHVSMKSMPVKNQYALLDNGSNSSSD
ncbi:Nn.00g087770.m01.CDS01 [Neocucurbitaria sp. VM-36]